MPLGMLLLPPVWEKLTRPRYFYERGTFEPAFPLLKAAESLFRDMNVQGCQGSLAAIYNTRAALETECNLFQQAYDDFKAQIDCVERAIETGELKRPCLTEVFALGGVGNGLQGLNNYTEAEEYYRRAIDAYSKFPQESLPLTELSVAPTNLATCLWLQGKLEEAETLLKSIIKDRDDTRNYRYIIINF